jgi:hypothetical protein
MVRGRAVASSLAIAVVIGLCGACSSGHSQASTAEAPDAAQARAVVSARKQAAAAQRRLALAERQVAAQRRAIVATIRRRHLRITTTTTVPPPRPTAVGPPASTPATTPTPAPAPPPVPGGSGADLAAIQRVVARLNASFRAGIAQGIATSAAVNYWVGAGVYTAAECASFEAASGSGVVAESLAVQPGSLDATPGWIDPVLGSVPAGHIYEVVLDDTQTIVTTGEQRERPETVHVTVLADGSARLFLRCA